MSIRKITDCWVGDGLEVDQGRGRKRRDPPYAVTVGEKAEDKLDWDGRWGHALQ